MYMIRDNVTGMRPKPPIWLMCVFLPMILNTVVMPWWGAGFGNGVKCLHVKNVFLVLWGCPKHYFLAMRLRSISHTFKILDGMNFIS